ncbi:hypothetical protein ACHAPQ_004708 [Fusarium lateritium]
MVTADSLQGHTLHKSVLQLGQGDSVEHPFPTVTSAFYHHARTFPDAIALRDLTGSPKEVTYSELAKRAQCLATQLISQGVCPDSRVPIVAKRGLDMIVAIWAVLSCGAQYVPLDGGVVPDETIRRVLAQAEGVVLCLASTKHRITTQQHKQTAVVINETKTTSLEEDSHIDLATPDSGCYVIYTSGTTGNPKGVDVTHRNVVNLVCLAPGNLGVMPGTCVGSVLNISFDMGESLASVP